MNDSDFKSGAGSKQARSELEINVGAFVPCLGISRMLGSNANSDCSSSIRKKEKTKKKKTVKWKNDGRLEIINVESWKSENKLVNNITSDPNNNCCIFF